MLKFLCVAVSAAFLLVGSAHAEEGARRSLMPWHDGAKPNVALTDIAGTHHDISTIRGQVVLVHFFATWCEPCVPELSSLRDLTERSRAKPLKVVAVDVGEVDARVRRFFKKLPVNFPVVLDRDRAVTMAWDVQALPTTYVLDGQLMPRFVAIGDIDWTRPDVVALLDTLIMTNSKQEEQL